MHRHHIIPKRLGGTDDAENLTPPISIALHAEFHRDLWEELGNVEDYIAWKALAGRKTSEASRLEAALIGQAKSEAYMNRDLKDHLSRVRTKETCSQGGKKAAPALVDWIRNNKEQHAEQCRISGMKSSERQKIPHEYMGKQYDSKKSLQEDTALSNTGFYSKLRKGEIVRMEKEQQK